MKKIFPLLLVLLLIFAITYFLKIRNVISTSCNISEKVKSTATTKNIFAAKAYLNEEIKKDSTVSKFSINLVLPYDLKVDCIQKIPIAAFKLDDGSFVLVDKEGQIVDKTKETSLPKILTSIVLDNTKAAFVSGLMSALHNFYNVNEGKISDSGLLVENIKGKSVIFPLSGDTELLLGEMNLIFSRLKGFDEASKIGTIDLRFKNPVLH